MCVDNGQVLCKVFGGFPFFDFGDLVPDLCVSQMGLAYFYFELHSATKRTTNCDG